MLHAGADTAERQRRQQAGKADGSAREHETGCRKQRAGDQHQHGPDALGQQRRGDLQQCHEADITAAQQSNLGIAEAKFGLPGRQQHVEQVGVAVV